MDRLRKFGLRTAFALLLLGIIIWIAGFFDGSNREQFQTLAVYLFVSAVFFASPKMIITAQKAAPKSRFETFGDMAVSTFYTGALLFVLYNAIPYFTTSHTISILEIAGQSALAISFLWTLCIHGWNAVSNLFGIFKPASS